MITELRDCLEQNPVIAAVGENAFSDAVISPAAVIFHLNANIMNIKAQIKAAHDADKLIFIHLDLAEGLGKDKSGIEYLSQCGADGIISTRVHLIRAAKELGMATVQRFFALDSKGLNGIKEMIDSAYPDMIEIMPGVIPKIISRFSSCEVPVIAGGLIVTKAEVTEALGSGAYAVSTGKKELWYI